MEGRGGKGSIDMQIEPSKWRVVAIESNLYKGKKGRETSFFFVEFTGPYGMDGGDVSCWCWLSIFPSLLLRYYGGQKIWLESKQPPLLSMLLSKQRLIVFVSSDYTASLFPTG